MIHLQVRSVIAVLAVTVLSLGALASPASAAKGGSKGRPTEWTPAPQTLTPPWQTPFENEWCNPEGSCDSDAIAWSDGYLEAIASLHTATSGPREGVAGASLDAFYHLPGPVSSVKIEITGIAGATAEATPADLTAHALTTLKAIASHTSCLDCGAQATSTLADSAGCAFGGCGASEPYTLTLELTSPTGTVPAGDINIRTILAAHVVAELGSAFAHGQGYLDEIVVTPVR